MSGNFAIKGGGGGGRLMANAILNFHFDFPHTSLSISIYHALDLDKPARLILSKSQIRSEKNHSCDSDTVLPDLMYVSTNFDI